MAEIVKTRDVFSDNGKKWITVNISFDALSQINKMILGDIPDENTKAEELRKQVHKDCISLFAEFK